MAIGRATTKQSNVGVVICVRGVASVALFITAISVVVLIPACSSRSKPDGVERTANGTTPATFVALIDQSSRTVQIPCVLMNDRDYPIEVVEVQRSCSCTSIDLSEGTQVPSQSALRFMMELHVSPHERERSVSCTVVTSDRQQPIRRYIATAELHPPISFSQAEVDLGELPAGKEALAELMLVLCAREGDVAEAVPQLHETGSGLIATLHAERETSEKKNSVVLRRIPVTARFKADGVTTGPLTLTASLGRRDLSSADVAFHWKQPREFVATPPRAVFRLISGEETSMDVLLARKDNNAFAILDVRASSPVVTTSWRFDSARGAVITATLGGISGDRHASAIFVTTDSELQPIITVPVIGYRQE